MTASDQELVVRRSVNVPLTRDRAFDLFTARMGEFWPPEHSIGSAAMDDVLVEPWVGGRWYERGVDGSECDWGRVAVWDSPRRVVLLWQIGADWKRDPNLETEVEVSFIDEGDGRTRLELVHRHLERYGEQAEPMRQVFDSPGGWTGTLARFIAAAMT